MIRKNLAPLKAELKKKREENSKLRSLVRSLREKIKVKSEENLPLSEQMQKFEEKKEVATHALAVIEVDLNRTKAELEQTKIYVDHLHLLERKAKLYPFTKKGQTIRKCGHYHAGRRDRMKRLILFGKLDWSPPMS